MTRRGTARRRDRSEFRQRLLVEGMDEDGLDRVVAILADGAGAGTGGIEPRGPVTLGQAEDPLSAAETIKRTIPQQGVNEERAGVADLGGALATPRGRLQEEVDFLGRQVRAQRAALARAGGAMGGDQRVIMEEFDPKGGPDPKAFAEQAMGPE